ncbi:MAG: hypothetical protein K2Q22_17375, partial [Cytophagales bacterium]|nr:hypothetical protein [Cytophagales bacterium]
MNKFLFLNKSLIITLLTLTTCSQPTKERVTSQPLKTSEASFAPVLVEPVTSPLPDELVELPKSSTKVVKSEPKSTSGTTAKSLAKRIPFDELLKANISFTENKGQLERFENFYFPALGHVKFYTKAFCGTAYFGNKGIGFGFQRGGLRDADFNVNGTPKEKLTKAERKQM